MTPAWAPTSGAPTPATKNSTPTAPSPIQGVSLPVKSPALLLFCLPVLAAATPFTAFRHGEVFTYKVGFAIFSRAGDLTISAHDLKVDGVDLMSVTTETRSQGIVREFYAFDNNAEVLIEKTTGRMRQVKEVGGTKKRPTDSETILDFTTRIAKHTDRIRPGRSAEIPIPDGEPVDLISALVQTRDWNLKPGDKRDLLVQFGRDFYPLSIYADHYEEVRTPLGKYKTLVLIPRMEKDPKGMFKKGGEIKVWISQDASSLPVKMQLKLNFGSATLLLSGYKKPEPIAAK